MEKLEKIHKNKNPRNVTFTDTFDNGAATDNHGVVVRNLKQSNTIFNVNISSEKCLSQRPKTVGKLCRENYQHSIEKTTNRNFRKNFNETDKWKRKSENCFHRNQIELETVEVLVSISFGIKNRSNPIGRYIKGTLSPTSSNQAPNEPPLGTGGEALLKSARDGDDRTLREQIRHTLTNDHNFDFNVSDSSGRTILSYIASNGTLDLLELILTLPGLDPNKADNEGNTPLHFAAQAGQVECLNCLASRCRSLEIDARNNLGLTPLMKAALQGRNKCAKLLLFAGANPALRDHGRGFRADQWARFCGRYVCADVIEKHARQRLLERSTSYGHWGLDCEMGAQIMSGKVVPIPPTVVPQTHSNGIKSRLKKVFRTSSGPSPNTFSSARLISQLTSAALCASSPVLPVNGSVPPVVKSLIRPLTVPRLQITLAGNNVDDYHPLDMEIIADKYQDCDNGKTEISKPIRNKKKK